MGLRQRVGEVRAPPVQDFSICLCPARPDWRGVSESFTEVLPTSSRPFVGLNSALKGPCLQSTAEVLILITRARGRCPSRFLEAPRLSWTPDGGRFSVRADNPLSCGRSTSPESSHHLPEPEATYVTNSLREAETGMRHGAASPGLPPRPAGVAGHPEPGWQMPQANTTHLS